MLTSVSRITISSVSVAEDYYINIAAQVLKGRVVKTPRLWGVALQAYKPEFIQTPRKQNRLEHSKDDVLHTLSQRLTDVRFAGATTARTTYWECPCK